MRCALAFILVIFAGPVRGQMPGDSTTNSLKDVTIEGQRMPDALRYIAQTYEVVIGLEEVIVPPFDKLLSIELRQVPISAALDAVMKADPRYFWRGDSNGPIRVFSRVSPPGLPNVVVNRLVVRELYRRDVSTMLNRAGEIRDWLNERKCSRVEYTTGDDWSQNDKRISLTARRMPLSEILDEIVLRSGTYFWAVFQLGIPGECQISIKF